MDRMSRLWAGVLLLGIVGVTVAPQSRADVLSAVAALRAGGCGGRAPLAAPLRHSPMLDQLAMQWAAGGAALQPIAAREGYSAGMVSGLHLSTEVASVPEKLSRSDCSTLSAPAWREIGFYQRKADTWLVLAGAAGHPTPQGTFVRQRPGAPPVSAAVRTADLSRRALQLVNEVRARGVRCGTPHVRAGTPAERSPARSATSPTGTRRTWPRTATSSTPISPARRPPTACGRRLSREARGREHRLRARRPWTRPFRGGCTARITARTSWIRASSRWVWPSPPAAAPQHGLYWVQVLAEPRA